MTPSLLILCFSNSLIRSLTSGKVNFFPAPSVVKRTSIVRTASK